jgi:cell division protein YceG involved in septum cleavage/N-acetylmuramoyl-L-alanine amidase
MTDRPDRRTIPRLGWIKRLSHRLGSIGETGREITRGFSRNDRHENLTQADVNIIGLLFLCGIAVFFAIGIVWHEAVALQRQGDQPRSVMVTHTPSTPAVSRQLWFPPGLRVDQVAAILDRDRIADGTRFLELVNDAEFARKLLGEEWGAVHSLEGYLSPGVYDVPDGMSANSLIGEMVARFEGEFAPQFHRRAWELGLTPHEVVILASIVERESIYYSDSPVIAGVFFNRLQSGIRLESDPTVAYAIDTAHQGSANEGWTTDLSEADLWVDSQYNTYLYPGLPPGPIASPGLQAIQSVLYYADVEYLFFSARANGAHAFASTLEEHIQNIADLYGDIPAGSLSSGTEGGGSDLQPLLERFVEGIDAHIGIVVKNLNTGEMASVNATDYFSTASLYKPLVMGYAFNAREQGEITFEDPITIPASAAVHDSEAVRARVGTTPTMREAIESMIVVSSSGVGETLLETFGRSEIEGFLRAQGLSDTWLSYARVISTPKDIARFMELAAAGSLVTPEASAEIVDILLRQEFNDLLPKYLPIGTAFAHKTGSLDYQSHDAGILYTSAGPIVIVVMTEEAGNKLATSESISRLGKFAFDYFEAYRPKVDEIQAGVASSCSGQPSTPGGSLSERVIVLDPRVAGDTGTGTARISEDSVLAEAEVTLDIAIRLGSLLASEGARVYLTQCDGTALPEMLRAAFANSVDADLFVSIGLDASPDVGVDGVTAHYSRPDGGILANYILGTFTQPALWQELATSLPLTNGGAHAGEFPVLTYTIAPGVVTESVNLTNPQEAQALTQDSARRDQIARGHFTGILNYFNAKAIAQ